MWNIFKAEFRYYYKFAFAITVCLNIWLAIAFSTGGKSEIEKDLVGVPTVALVVTAFIVFFMMVDRAKAKRNRFHAMLPLSIRHTGISRFLSLYVFWVLILIFFCLTLVIFRSDAAAGDVLKRMLTFNGIFLYINATYIMSRDLRFCFSGHIMKKGIRIYYIPGVIILFVNMLLLIYFVLLPVPYIGIIPLYHITFVQFIFSPIGAIILNIAGIVLTILGIGVYTTRKSFLE